jgi:hypothetical protein
LGICTNESGKYDYISGYGRFANCDTMERRLTYRPLASEVDGSNFQHYQSGVFNDCQQEHNLAGLLVGGKEGYYRLKLSWGTSWGEGGYIRLERNGSNICGICTGSYYVL